MFDAETGNDLARNRYYNIALATWVIPDPAESSPNLYEYCDGNPANETDPSGLVGEACWSGSLTGSITVDPSSVSVNKWGVIGGLGKIIPGTTISLVQDAMVAFYKAMAGLGFTGSYNKSCRKGEHCSGIQVTKNLKNVSLNITQWIWVNSNGGGKPTILLPPMNKEPTDAKDIKNHKSKGYVLYSITCKAIFNGTFTGLEGTCVKDKKDKTACINFGDPGLA